MRMMYGKKIFAVAVCAFILAACGKSKPTQSVTEKPAEEAVGSRPEEAAVQETEPTATPSPEATPTPTPDPVYVRPSFANVAVGENAYADERGSFITVENSLVVLLPTDENGGYVWDCLENGGDENFSYTERDADHVPYTYTSGKYGGIKTPKSEVRAAESRSEDSIATESIPTGVPEPEQEESVYEQPEEYVIEEYVVTEYDDGYEEYPEEYVDEYPEEYTEEVYWDENGEPYEPVSVKIPALSGTGGISRGIQPMSASVGSTANQDDYTYVYAPGRKEFTFTASSAGTSIYCLEYTQNHTSLDSGFILYAHADEDLQVTFDLVWYSFSECVAAPDGVPEAEATVTAEQAAERAASAAETFDSCVRTNNMIGAAAEMVEGAYWEAYVMDSWIAGISGNGGSFYHENYADYAWDVFTIEPVSPGRTSAYFVYRTGDDTPMPRIQVADIQVAEDMTVTMHVRRFDMGVEFD
jgi:hypothetical protein